MITACYFEIARTAYFSRQTQCKSVKDPLLLKAADVSGRREKPAHSRPAHTLLPEHSVHAPSTHRPRTAAPGGRRARRSALLHLARAPSPWQIPTGPVRNCSDPGPPPGTAPSPGLVWREGMHEGCRWGGPPAPHCSALTSSTSQPHCLHLQRWLSVHLSSALVCGLN